MIMVIMITIILFFQLCHKPKQLREILRQAVKTQTQLGSLIFNGDLFTLKQIASYYLEKSSLHWVTGRPLLNPSHGE